MTEPTDIRIRRAVLGLLFSLFVSLAAACGAASPGAPADSAGGAASPAATEGRSGRAPTDRSVPGVTPAVSGTPTGPIDTPEEARAAVVARFPEYAGYQFPELALPHPSGYVRGFSGAPDRLVVAWRNQDGFRLEFTTGSGDCPSGCTSVRVDTFLVDAHGSVTGPVTIGAETSR